MTTKVLLGMVLVVQCPPHALPQLVALQPIATSVQLAAINLMAAAVLYLSDPKSAHIQTAGGVKLIYLAVSNSFQNFSVRRCFSGVSAPAHPTLTTQCGEEQCEMKIYT